jgi:hypothetical protein
MAKYLASVVDSSTLDWEQYLPALKFSYNTSFHSTISTTPHELLYGMKARTPSLPAQDIQRKFYGESFASERLQILQKAREIAKQNIDASQAKYKQQHDKKAKPHDFSIGQQVWYSQTEWIGKNKKLAPKWLGPALIIQINESVAVIKLSNNKTKALNVKRLKHFFPREEEDSEAEDESAPDDTVPNKNAPEESEAKEFNQEKLINFDSLTNTSRPNTRAWAKLSHADAISELIKEETWYKLNNIAFKLYHSNLEFEDLTSQELKFWKSFDQEDIFEVLTGSPIHPPCYAQYWRITSSPAPEQEQTQPNPQPQQPAQGPNPDIPAPPAPEPKKKGRPPGSKNKPKDAFSRAAHYASKRLTRAASKLLPSTNPPTNQRDSPAPT